MPTFGPQSPGPRTPGRHPRRWAGFQQGVVDTDSATPPPGSVYVKTLRGGPGSPGRHPRRWAGAIPGIPDDVANPTVPLGTVYVKALRGGPGSPGLHPRRWAAFVVPARAFTLSGVTRDSGGAVYPSAIVKLFRTVDDSKIGEMISDPVTGAFSFTVWSGAEYFYVVAFAQYDGNPCGVTVNTTVGV